MSDALWDFTPAPVAKHRARVRETLLSFCDSELAPLLHLTQDVAGDRDLAAETLMAMCTVYRDDLYGHLGRDLARARLAQDLEVDRGDAIGEAQ